MLSYRKLAMCVLGRPLHTGGGIDLPRPASQRAAALVLTAAMLTTLAAPAFAGTWYIENGDITVKAGETGNDVTQNNVTTKNDTDTIITNSDKDTASSNTVTIDAENDKVEVKLDNVNIKADSGSALTSKGDVTLALNGDNHLTGGISGTGNYGRNGIASTGSLTISGGENDSLTAQGGSGADGSYGGHGIYSNGSLTISGGTVNATGGDGSNVNGSGISSNGSVTISGGTVTANGGNGGNVSGDGIRSDGGVTISGGTVKAAGGNSADGGGGITSNGGVTISGGTIDAKGGDGSSRNGGSGIYSSNSSSVTISGGTVKTTGGNGNVSGGCGIYNSGSLIISDGTVNATGGNGKDSYGGYGISSRDVAISGGTVTANGGDTKDGYGGNGISSSGDIELSGSLELTAKAGKGTRSNGKALSQKGSELDLDAIKDKLDPGANIVTKDADGSVIDQVSIPRPVEPEESSSSSDGGSAAPSAPASPLPGLTVTDKDGQRISYTSTQSGNTLTVCVGRLTASFRISLAALRQLRAEGIETITFQTILCSTTLSVDELPAMGGEDAEAVLTHRFTDSSLTVG